MTRVKMLTVTAFAAAMLGVGGLAAPSAHAQPNQDACEGLRAKAIASLKAAQEWASIGANAAVQRNLFAFTAYWDAYKVCVDWPGAK